MEVWKDIQGLEGQYQVSNIGRVKSLKRVLMRSNGYKQTIHEKIMNPSIVGGYYGLLITDSIGRGIKKVHRLVAQTFIPNPETKRTVNHKNGIKTDNRVENLEWSTYSENIKHAYKNGLNYSNSRKGELHKKSKLTKNEAIKIKYSHKSLSQKDIAKIYGVSQYLISLIRSGKNWNHI